MSSPELRLCPACHKEYPSTNFECLPLDVRCNRCIPAEQAMALYDQRVKQAGQKLTQIFDASDKASSLRPLERMVSQAYDSWGGAGAFCDDVVTWIKDLADLPRTKAQAVAAAMKLLTLHAKVDRMKLEDDWKQMDDEQLRERLKLKMLHLWAEANQGEAKAEAVKHILGDKDA